MNRQRNLGKSETVIALFLVGHGRNQQYVSS